MARHVNLLSMSNDDKGTDFYAYYLIPLIPQHFDLTLFIST